MTEPISRARQITIIRNLLDSVMIDSDAWANRPEAITPGRLGNSISTAIGAIFAVAGPGTHVAPLTQLRHELESLDDHSDSSRLTFASTARERVDRTLLLLNLV